MQLVSVLCIVTSTSIPTLQKVFTLVFITGIAVIIVIVVLTFVIRKKHKLHLVLGIDENTYETNEEERVLIEKEDKQENPVYEPMD